MSNYFIANNSQREGPYPIDELLSHGLRSETLVWTKGMAQWLPAANVPILKDLLDAKLGAGPDIVQAENIAKPKVSPHAPADGRAAMAPQPTTAGRTSHPFDSARSAVSTRSSSEYAGAPSNVNQSGAHDLASSFQAVSIINPQPSVTASARSRSFDASRAMGNPPMAPISFKISVMGEPFSKSGRLDINRDSLTITTRSGFSWGVPQRTIFRDVYDVELKGTRITFSRAEPSGIFTQHALRARDPADAARICSVLPRAMTPEFATRRSLEQHTHRDYTEPMNQSRAFPLVTVFIMLANVAVYVAMGVTGAGWFSPSVNAAMKWGADYWPATTGGQWWRLFTSAFVHLGIIHIACNMFALSQAGILTERLYGKRFYILLYAYGAVMSGLVSTWWDQTTVCAGASGAIFAVFGALLAYLILHRGAFPRAVLGPLMTSTCTFIAYNMFYGLMQKNISNSAHISGLLTGFVLGLVIARPMEASRRQRQTWPRLAAGSVVALAILCMALYRMPKTHSAQLAFAGDTVTVSNPPAAPSVQPPATSPDLPVANPPLTKKNRFRITLPPRLDPPRASPDEPDSTDPAALFKRGVACADGTGVPQDFAKAMEWYLKAAALGSGDAMNNIGAMYVKGQGVPIDYDKARSWYRRASAAGSAMAALNLGNMYLNAIGVTQDYAQAMIWFKTAADAGNTEAMNNVGDLYYYGHGVPLDYNLAFPMYEKAANAGLPVAMWNMGYLYSHGQGVTRDYDQAVKWYKQAADLGQSDAMTDLGGLYAEGNGVLKNEYSAVYWYQKGVTAGNVRAMRYLAQCYFTGTGVTQDLLHAQHLYRAAADRGDADSKQWLADHP